MNKDFIKKQKEIFTLLAFLIVFTGIIYGVIMPLISRVNNTKNEIQEEIIKQEAKRARLNEIPVIKKQYENLQGEEKDIADALISRDNAVILIEELEKIAQETGNEISISITDKQVQNPKAQAAKNNEKEVLMNNLPSSEFMKMSLSLNGSYNSLVKFVTVLESLNYYSDIIVINMKENDEVKEGSVSQTSSLSLNPFNVLQKKTPNENISVKDDKKGAITMTLEVVFYTKKQ